MKTARRFTGRITPYITKRDIYILKATTAIEDEVFSSLEYISEIESNGYKFIKDKGFQNYKRIFRQFQSFIRQAKTFYLAATKIHYRASALIYYYSFLNLVKAKISISDPNFLLPYVNHGLSCGDFSHSPITKQFVKTKTYRGVFPKFYKIETNNTIPNKKRLSIIDLLAYCSDVSHEYTHAGYGSSKLLYAKSCIAVNDNDAWILTAIDGFSKIRSYKKTLMKFNNYFEEVSLEKNIAKEIFGFHAWNLPPVSFFESRDIVPNDESFTIQSYLNSLIDAFNGIYEPIIYKGDYDFKLCIPLRLNDQTLFNQALSIYTIMFFIGSLVRYYPDYLEGLLNSRDAWIIERFVKSSPITFIRYMASSILDTEYIYVNR